MTLFLPCLFSELQNLLSKPSESDWNVSTDAFNLSSYTRTDGRPRPASGPFSPVAVSVCHIHIINPTHYSLKRHPAVCLQMSCHFFYPSHLMLKHGFPYLFQNILSKKERCDISVSTASSGPARGAKQMHKEICIILINSGCVLFFEITL